MLGPDNTGFVEALAQSRAAETLEALTVGWSHDLYGGTARGADLAQVTGSLSAHDWPALRHLSLGHFELLFNGHARYERLGNISALLSGMPRLETLDLAGNFRLDAPLRHTGLKRLTVSVDDPVTSLNGGAPNPASVEALFRSELPALEYASIDLECVTPASEASGTPHRVEYELDRAWLARARWPRLERLEIAYSGAADNQAAIRERALSEWPGVKLFLGAD